MQKPRPTSRDAGPSAAHVSADAVSIDPPLLLTTTDAARLLSIGRTTLYSLIADGSIQPVHIGRSCRVSTAELQRYVDQLQAAS